MARSEDHKRLTAVVCAAFACLSLGTAASADDLFRFGVDRVTLGWQPADSGVVHGYVVMLSTNGGVEAYHDTVLTPRITLEGQPWDVLVARVRTLGQEGPGGPVIVSEASQASQLIRFIPAPIWSGQGLVALHCATCATLQLRAVSNQTPPTELPSHGAPWRLVSIDQVDAAAGYDALWQNDTTGTLEVIGVPSASMVPSATTTALGPQEVLGLAEIDGDATREIVVRRSPDALEFWKVSGSSIELARQIPAIGQWTFVTAADADGDGISEIWWQTPVSGRVQVWKLNAAGTLRVLFTADTSAPGELVEVADFDADGLLDTLWRDTTGHLTIRYLTADGTLKGSYQVPYIEGDWNLRVRAAVEVDDVPGAEIVVQDQQTFRVIAILTNGPSAPLRYPMFDVERPFELQHAR